MVPGRMESRAVLDKISERRPVNSPKVPIAIGLSGAKWQVGAKLDETDVNLDIASDAVATRRRNPISGQASRR